MITDPCPPLTEQLDFSLQYKHWWRGFNSKALSEPKGISLCLKITSGIESTGLLTSSQLHPLFVTPKWGCVSMKCIKAEPNQLLLFNPNQVVFNDLAYCSTYHQKEDFIAVLGWQPAKSREREGYSVTMLARSKKTFVFIWNKFKAALPESN